MKICTLTESAKEQVRNLCTENQIWGISLSLRGGGCAGFEYNWGTVKTENDRQKGDFVIEVDNCSHFVIEKSSLMFLAGTVVDYKKTLVGSNFEIKNPNTESSCGCGVSVNFDMNKVESNTPAIDLSYRA